MTIDHLTTSLVTFTDDHTGSEPATTKCQGPALGPVVPTQAGVVIGCATELAHDQQNRRIVKASLDQIINQRRQRPVGGVSRSRCPSSLLEWVSQELPRKPAAVTKRVPDSTRRLASRRLWPTVSRP